MSKWHSIVLAGIFVCGVPTALRAELTTETKESRRPNIVLMLADDLGYSDLSCYGSSYHETPHLDALARQGMRFTDAYAAAPICSPSRAAILSGKFPARFALTHYIHKQDAPKAKRREAARKLTPARFEEFMPLEEVTIAETLKSSGYKTFVAGKWHLGKYDVYGPEKQGFDVAVGTQIGGHTDKYFSPYDAPGLSDGPAGEYLTDRLSSETVSFIRDNRDKPFFIYHAFYAVHTPIQGKPALVERYKAKAETAQLKHETVMEGQYKVKANHSDPAYAAMVNSMDEAAGNIINTIKELGLERDTLIIFTSDNGGLATGGKDGGPTTNKPLRAGKGWMYEGGLRVPLIAAWPGSVAPGQETSGVVSGADIYPTILDAAGLPLLPAQHVDGKSFLPVLKGGKLDEAERPIFWHFPHYGNQNGTPGSAVRRGKWKLIKWYEGNRLELFDMETDKEERQNLAEKHPETTQELEKLLENWLSSINARLPEEKLSADEQP